MKKILFMLLISPLLLATSCDEDDDSSIPNTTLTGRWNLVNVSGGLQGQDFDIPNGSITWTFNANNTVQVVNNNPADGNAEDFFETGTYNYQYTTNEVSTTCNQTLKIDDIDLGCQNIQGNTMTLSQVEADGYLLTLKK